MKELTLFGFNNLTKSLSFSLYKLHHITEQETCYNQYIKSRYNADNLNRLLTNICHAIGGSVLNVAKQDYQPQGASVTLMISEEMPEEPITKALAEALVAHLDKSHLCIHTYPEESPQDNIAIFRADIELSTCGIISPLKVLDHVIEIFDADVIDIDYRIRGMTRNKEGKKLFNIDQMENISEFLSESVIKDYAIKEYNLPRQNLFHTKLRRKNITLANHLIEYKGNNLSIDDQVQVEINLANEIQQLFTSETA